jgi:hypothetical protein
LRSGGRGEDEEILVRMGSRRLNIRNEDFRIGFSEQGFKDWIFGTRILGF